jgi:peptide deformylase
MILPIHKYGSPVLRKKAFNIDKGDLFKEIAENMTLTLKKSDGIGLAGPQVGTLKNIFIIDTTTLKDKGFEKVEKAYFNPVIIHYSDNTVCYNEGCLSIPGINEEVLRPDKIEVRYLDENFDWREEVLDGLIARIFQHEYDHLQGVLFIDRLSQLKKKLIKEKLQEIKKREK